ncbi:energy transducer TonB [Luteimonas aquatica]|uniref:energy transducer TonB n=1 Tax=Luteimonas aquatica TaxID=450364 RepID=UPI001F566F63|nr:energy transducer TonB [Luteimonas aquatica]
MAILLAGAFLAQAAGPKAVRAQAESSMLLTGTLAIAADGSVKEHALDQRDKLPSGVAKLVADNVAKWRFRPATVPGGAEAAQVNMSLLIVAKKLDEEHYKVSIRAANFMDARQRPGETVTGRRLAPPQYPKEAAASRINGVVFLLLRVGRKGTVEDAFVEQVNLRVVGSDPQMAKARDMLSRNALQAAKHWTFNPPTASEEAGEDAWVVRVPVDYLLWGASRPAYGEWTTYIPGPRQRPAWADEDDASTSPEAMLAGGVYMVGDGPRLLTPLEQG